MTHNEYETRVSIAEDLANLSYEYGADQERDLTVLTSLMFAALSIAAPRFYDEEVHVDGINDGYDENNIEDVMLEGEYFSYPREARDELVEDIIKRERRKQKNVAEAKREIDKIFAKAS